MEIKIEHNPGSLVNDLGVTSWPIWACEASQFPWTYDEKETCYILEGEVIVTPDGGKDVIIKAGDLVVFPKGMSCHWNIVKPIRKHYKFG
ncbi:MAG: cupin domain-containing protein [Deltaproteobacteria bacterium]|nr:cupin domain-containing protein [Deltaproteobacteria bacterium]